MRFILLDKVNLTKIKPFVSRKMEHMKNTKQEIHLNTHIIEILIIRRMNWKKML